MVLSYYPPAKVVQKLITRERAPFNVCPGKYRLLGNKVFLTLDSVEKHVEVSKKCGWEDETQRKTTYNMVRYKYKL